MKIKQSYFVFIAAMLAPLFMSGQALAVPTHSGKIAYILPQGVSYSAGTFTGFPTDEQSQTPELNAAKWFYENYVNTHTLGYGEFLTLSEVKSGNLITATYQAAWCHLERQLTTDDAYNVNQTIEGNNYIVNGYSTYQGQFASQVSACYTEGGSTIKEQLRNFVAAGGNLYLSRQATWLAYDMGRINYSPNLNTYSYETGKPTNDYFCSTAYLGRKGGVTPTDRTTHPIFVGPEGAGTGLVASSNSDYWHNGFQLVNTPTRQSQSSYATAADYRNTLNWGWRELFPRNQVDGVSFLPGGYDGNAGDVNRLYTFESELSGWKAKVLAIDFNIDDYCYSEIVEFLPAEHLKVENAPNAEWKGTVLCNGAWTYQWTSGVSSTPGGEGISANTGVSTVTVSSGVTDLTYNTLYYLTRDTETTPLSTLEINDDAYPNLGDTYTLSSAGIYNNVTYNRTYTTGRSSTIFLPCSIDEEACSRFGKFYRLEYVYDKKLYYMQVKRVEANTPYLFIPGGSGTIQVTNFENSTAVATPASKRSIIDVGNAQMVGTYERIEFSTADTKKIYAYDSANGVFKTTNGTITVPVFRAYIYMPSAPAAAKQFPVEFIDFDENTVSGIVDLSRAQPVVPDARYNLMGQRITSSSAKGIIISNGKKYLSK